MGIVYFSSLGKISRFLSNVIVTITHFFHHANTSWCTRYIQFSYLVIVNKISVHPTTSACSVENEEPWQFNNVKGGIRNRKLKDRSCNDKQRKGQTIIYKTLYRKLQIEQHETKNRKYSILERIFFGVLFELWPLRLWWSKALTQHDIILTPPEIKLKLIVTSM
jgi:hypothetical protein